MMICIDNFVSTQTKVSWSGSSIFGARDYGVQTSGDQMSPLGRKRPPQSGRHEDALHICYEKKTTLNNFGAGNRQSLLVLGEN